MSWYVDVFESLSVLVYLCVAQVFTSQIYARGVSSVPRGYLSGTAPPTTNGTIASR